MNIKEVLSYLNDLPFEQLFNDQIIKSIKQKKQDLSKRDKRFLLKKLSEFRKFDVHFIFCVILTYSIWYPDEAVIEARKKGVFRYKAWGFKINCAELLLKKIKEVYTLISYSDNTKQFIDKKLMLSWMFDFYKKCEEDLIKYIKEHHRNRRRTRNGNVLVEEALFKELLAYADAMFYLNNRSYEYINKHKLEGYGHEEISDGISYIIYLYNATIGIKSDSNYTVSAQYVLSDEIEKKILMACKVNQLQEWEICIDYFNYNVKSIGRNILISDDMELFEKSIRLGYVRRDMQEQLFFHENIKHSEEKYVSLSEVGGYIKDKLGEQLVKEVGTGALSRYRFEFPEPLFNPFQNPDEFQGKLFKEEMLSIAHNAREMIMNNGESLEKKITNNCTLIDVVLFQRFFSLMNLITSQILFEQKDRKKIIRSLVPHFQYEGLINILTVFMGDRVKAEELLQLFTYKKDIKLDLQYTPFIEASSGLLFSNSLVSKSNLLRNCIAYSYSAKNQLVNQDDRETLVQECVQIFSERNQDYGVFSNKKFSFCGQNGEIDVLVISDQDIIIIECKSPLNPTSNFEMRASVEHINKAAKQLEHCKAAFMDKAFRKKYLKNLSIPDKARRIHTCIVFGNRLFNGYDVSGHPIRYVRELDMIINNGHIYSDAATWRVWQSEEFKQEELISFLSPDHPLMISNINSMEKVEQYMFIKGRKVCYETYVYNLVKAMEQYDMHFTTKNNNDSIREQINSAYEKNKS
ncbi:nuclease-related domain-containing protein [Aquibacillus rhizosphaerae]|uniref:Nuclease-related domain-containing protein n=1 Tax=Aquibacillus rhizosphaerae TaxID=3051431 RepID=A0ABT7L9C4_9BACI|nr:nuclease-related domain-containing protein [Aquibacillus sp. LR5S19]MDL4842463.1 nuclease-related domain-containing protein [Aquibacillus sp. LR5S19]